jgi:hypothetical protein
MFKDLNVQQNLSTVEYRLTVNKASDIFRS